MEKLNLLDFQKELQKIIPEIERFKINIQINNNEIIITGKNGEECSTDIDKKEISQIINELKPCIFKIIKI